MIFVYYALFWYQLSSFERKTNISDNGNFHFISWGLSEEYLPRFHLQKENSWFPPPWIKHNNVRNRILRSQKDPYKDWSNNVKKADVNNISTGQYRSSGLLGKTTNIQNIYYCKIVKGSYMVWRGKVWLLRGLMVLAVWMRYASRAFLRQSRS